MKYSVCLLAAGKGSRTKLNYNKVFYKLINHKSAGKETILDCSLSIFLEDPDCRQVIITCAPKELDLMCSLYRKYDRVQVVIGGTTRQDSVERALKAVKYPFVFIHDAARPYLKREQIEALKHALKKEKACLLMVPSIDTIKTVENGYVKETMVRSEVYHAQTPQCFETKLIKECHVKAKKEHRLATDDAQLVEWYSDTPIRVVVGDTSNKKITLPSDLK